MRAQRRLKRLFLYLLIMELKGTETIIDENNKVLNLLRANKTSYWIQKDGGGYVKEKKKFKILTLEQVTAGKERYQSVFKDKINAENQNRKAEIKKASYNQRLVSHS